MLFIPFFVWFFNKVLKIIVTLIKAKKWDSSYLVHSGGMPSGHTAFTTSLALVLGYSSGFDSLLFLMALVFTVIVITDARGVRYQAQKHAIELNKLLPKSSKKLHERLGHTDEEVIVGVMVGIIFTIVTLHFAHPLTHIIDTYLQLLPHAAV